MPNSITIKSKIQNYNKKIFVSGDKSLSIRWVLFSSIASGISKAKNLLTSEDVMAAIQAVRKLGIKVVLKGNTCKIYGKGFNGYKFKKNLIIDSKNSGTLGRLILGILVNCSHPIKLIGDKSLSKRDFKRIIDPLKLFGANINSNKTGLPVNIVGSDYLRPIDYHEKLGSAQCKSAVMLAALKTPGITKIKAKKSRNHTELLYKNLNIPIKIKKKLNHDFIEVKGISNFKGFSYKIPGDISSCSFFIVLALLTRNSRLVIKNVNINSTRIGIIKILNKMNAKIKFINKRKYKGEIIADIIVNSRKELRGINCPKNLNSSAIDEFLIIFLVAARAKGISKFNDLGEMNKKESQRLDLAIKFLRSINVKVNRFKNNISIHGNPNLNLKGKFEMKNFLKDHRIFFLSCITALTLGGRWKIFDKDSINTSFPDFLKILKKVGAKIN